MIVECQIYGIDHYENDSEPGNSSLLVESFSDHPEATCKKSVILLWLSLPSWLHLLSSWPSFISLL